MDEDGGRAVDRNALQSGDQRLDHLCGRAARDRRDGKAAGIHPAPVRERMSRQRDGSGDRIASASDIGAASHSRVGPHARLADGLGRCRLRYGQPAGGLVCGSRAGAARAPAVGTSVARRLPARARDRRPRPAIERDSIHVSPDVKCGRNKSCLQKLPIAMDHHHDHSHAGGNAGDMHPPGTFGFAFAVGVALNMTIVAAELVFGYAANSLALIADAAHNFSDVIGLVLAWAAAWLALRRPTQQHTYGYRRASILAALINAGLLLLAVGGITVEALRRFQAPATVASQTVIFVAILGVIVN